MRVAAFELGELAGKGGTSLVWHARHDGGEPAVVKVLMARFARNPVVRGALAREVRAVARLDHPGIVRVFDHGVVSEAMARESGGDLPAGSPWMALEWVDGPSFRGGVPRDWAGLRDFLVRLLGALAHSHARGVIHRDIKPGNILMRRAAHGIEPVLTDFGIAAALGVDPPEALISAGTPRYSPPEQLSGRWSAQGAWTDLYALGTSLKHVFGDWGPDGAPLEYEVWLERLTARAPFDRFFTVAEALEALPGGDEGPRAVRGLRPTAIQAGLPLFGLRTPPVVGLEAVRRTVGEAVDRALSGESVTVDIDGPPGSGRSRLAGWAAERFAVGGGRLVEVVGGPGAGPAEWALRTLLGATGDAVDPELWGPVLGPAFAREVAGLLDAGSLRSGAAVRLLALALARLAERVPVGVCIDPLPAVPEGQAVCRALRRAEVPHLALLVGGESVAGAVSVELTTPTPAEAAQILEAFLPLERAETLRLVHAAGGDVVRALDHLSALVAAEHVQPAGSRWRVVGELEVPPAAEVKLPPLLRFALGVSTAVEPHVGPADDAALEAVGIGPDLRVALEERGLLQVDNGRYRCTSLPENAWPPGVVEAAEQVLGGVDDPLARARRSHLLRWLGRGGEATELGFAALVALNGAYRHDQALLLSEQLLPHLEEGSERWVRASYLRILALGHIGSLSRAVAACEALEAKGEALGVQLARAVGATEGAFWLHRSGETERALAQARRAVEVARGTRMESSAWLYVLHTLPAKAHDEAREAYEAGVASCADRPLVHADLMHSHAIRLHGRGESAAALDLMSRLLELPVSQGQRVQARSMMGEILLARGDLDEAIGHLRFALEAAGRDGDPTYYVLGRVNLALAYLRSDRPADARGLLEPLLEHFDPAARLVWPVVQFVLFAVAARQGRLDEARARLQIVEDARNQRILHQPDSIELIDAALPWLEGRLARRVEALRAHLEASIGR